MSDPFHIMAKPVCGVCNLACRYCYYKDKPRELYPREKDFRMSPQVLESFVRQYMESQPQRCEFGWQGGEPLLAGREFFQGAVELQERFGRAGQTVANAIQTNGTLLDEEWCEFLARRQFLVGISLDGAPQWHDAFRRDGAGNASHHRAWAGVELLRKHNVEFNVLVTLHSASAGHGSDLYRYFVNRGVRYLQFIPILERRADGMPEDFSCPPDLYGRFLLEVFEQWAARDVGQVSERFIDGILHKILFGTAALCCQAERCASAFVLEYNGDLYACDHFVTERWLLGNILRRPLVDLVADPLLEEFSRLKTRLPAACRDCEFLEYCNGGCPKHHVPLYGGADRVNYFCEAYKMFFRAALPELKRLAEEYSRGAAVVGATGLPDREARANGGESGATGRSLSGAAVEAEARADGEPDVHGPHLRVGPRHRENGGAYLPPSPKSRSRVGRNAPCPCGSGRKFKACCGRGR